MEAERVGERRERVREELRWSGEVIGSLVAGGKDRGEVVQVMMVVGVEGRRAASGLGPSLYGEEDKGDVPPSPPPVEEESKGEAAFNKFSNRVQCSCQQRALQNKLTFSISTINCWLPMVHVGLVVLSFGLSQRIEPHLPASALDDTTCSNCVVEVRQGGGDEVSLVSWRRRGPDDAVPSFICEDGSPNRTTRARVVLPAVGEEEPRGEQKGTNRGGEWDIPIGSEDR